MDTTIPEDDTEEFLSSSSRELDLRRQSRSVGAERVAALCRNTRLQSIALSNCKLTEEVVTVLSLHPTITSLHIEDTDIDITIEGVKALSRNTNITSLVLSGHVSDVGGPECAKIFSYNTTIRSLMLHSIQMGMKGPNHSR